MNRLRREELERRFPGLLAVVVAVDNVREPAAQRLYSQPLCAARLRLRRLSATTTRKTPTMSDAARFARSYREWTGKTPAA